MLLPKVWLSFCAVLSWICLCTRQGNPQGREPCSPVYHSRPFSRYSIYASWGSLHLWPWSDLVGIHSISLAAWYRVAACSTTLSQGLEKINMARGFRSLSPIWENNFLFHPWPSALRMRLILFVAWTVMTHLTKSHKSCNLAASGQAVLARLCWTSFFSCLESPGTDQSSSCCLHPAQHENCLSCFLVLGYSLASFASYVMGSALHRDPTLKNMITSAVLDAQMNLTL